MRPKIFVACLGIAALIAAVTAATLALRTPYSRLDAGKLFCAATQAGSSDAARRRLLTEDMQLAWKDAAARNDAVQRASPDEKPPLGDGMPWQSHPDYTPVCAVGRIILHHGVTMVEIHHNVPENPSWSWTDRLVLKQSGSQWLVDDVLYEPDYKRSLRQTIIEAFKP